MVKVLYKGNWYKVPNATIHIMDDGKVLVADKFIESYQQISLEDVIDDTMRKFAIRTVFFLLIITVIAMALSKVL